MVGRLELRDDFKKQAEWDFHLKKSFSVLRASASGIEGPTRVQPVRKPAVNRSEQFARLLRLALVAPEGEAHGGAEFPGFCLLLTCNRERTLEIRFRFRCIRRMRLKRDQGTELPNSKTRSPDPRRAFVLTGSVQPRSCN